MEYRRFLHEFPEDFFNQSVRVGLSVLLLILLGILGAGISRLALDFFRHLPDFFDAGSSHQIVRHYLVETLSLLAVLEVFRTVKNYFRDGRVKVTYIIDTVLVALLTEVLAFWYRDIASEKLYLVLLLVGGLMVVRILAIQFSPNRRAVADGL